MSEPDDTAGEPATVMLTGRVEAFSDGVIAIAITLLVLDLKVPDHGGSLAVALRQQWPAYLGYATSFVTIGIMWVNHHTMFDHMERVDRTLLFANLGLLAGIATLPFMTSLAAQWLRDDGDNRIAVMLYCLSLVAISSGFAALWLYLRRHPNLLATRHRGLPQRAIRRSLVGPAAYGVAAGVALAAPVAAFVLCDLIACYFIRPQRP